MLFRSVLLNLHVFGTIPVIFLLFISGLIPLQSEGRFCIVSILLNLLKCVVRLAMWSIFVNILCVLKKNVYSAVVG